MDKRYPNVILGTACIPWTEAGTFDEVNFRLTVRGLIERNVRHLYLFGTAGEGYAVTDSQFGQITRCFAELMAGEDCYPMVGLISLSFPTMCERLQAAYAAGIRDFMFALPAWGALQDDELALFLHRLCDPYPDCRFVHYNNPRSKRVLTIADYECFAAEIPSLAGVKYSISDPAIIRGLADSVNPLRFFLTENGFAIGSAAGDFGLLLSIASANMAMARQFHQAGLHKDLPWLQTLQQELAQMVQALLVMVGSRIDGAYDKIFCKIMNPEFPLRLLPPYMGATDAAYLDYCRYLQEQLPHWIE